MNRVQRKVEYSLMALKHMRRKGPSLTTAKEVAETYRTPFDVTARVMQVMAQRGWLKAELGALGGYALARDLSQLSLLDLMEVIQGPGQIARCMEGKDQCELEGHCNIVSPIKVLNTKMNDFYRSVSLEDLLKEN